MIRDAAPSDVSRIAAIYNHYILNTHISFEEQAVSAGEIAARMAEVQQSLPWLVHERDGVVDGYCYAGKWRGRFAYRFAVETTVYLHPDSTGQGIGGRLYAELIDRVRQRGMHAAIGGIALPNDASIALHERHGFVKVAQFREVGRKLNRWIDVGYWQLMLDKPATPS